MAVSLEFVSNFDSNLKLLSAGELSSETVSEVFFPESQDASGSIMSLKREASESMEKESSVVSEIKVYKHNEKLILYVLNLSQIFGQMICEQTCIYLEAV